MTKEWLDFIAMCEHMKVTPADAADCIAHYWERNARLATESKFPETATSSLTTAAPFRGFCHRHKKPITYQTTR